MQETDAFLCQLRQDGFVPAAVLRGDELLSAGANALQLCDRPHAVGRIVLRSPIAECLFAQTGNSDHKELVQVRAEDRQEFDALQQRVGRVLGFLQYTRIELQPAQFAVDKVFGKKCLFVHAFVTQSLPVAFVVIGQALRGNCLRPDRGLASPLCPA